MEKARADLEQEKLELIAKIEEKKDLDSEEVKEIKQSLENLKEELDALKEELEKKRERVSELEREREEVIKGEHEKAAQSSSEIAKLTEAFALERE